MFQGLRKSAAILFLLLGSLSCWADGKVFRHVEMATGPVTIPDQRALICWSNGVERLVIETSFQGSGSNFAWVVPVPAPPQIEEASAGLFPTLEYLFRPSIRQVEPLWPLAGLLVILVVWFTKRPPLNRSSSWAGIGLVVGLSFGLGPELQLMGLVMAPAVMLAFSFRHDPATRQTRLIDALLALVIGSIAAGMLLPALSRAKGDAGASPIADSVNAMDRVTLMDRVHTASYDSTVVRAADPEALMSWLRTNRFEAPESIRPVLADYIRSNWVFVATRMHTAPASGSFRTPPLAFTFASARPVYPMKLTGVAATNLSVELFVFGPQSAEAAGWETVRTGAAFVSQEADRDQKIFVRRPNKELTLGHPYLRLHVPGQTVATQLRAVLRPDQMTDDVWLTWRTKAAFGAERFSHKSAAIWSANWAAAVFLLLAYIGWLGPDLLTKVGIRRVAWWSITAAATLGIWGLIYAGSPSVPSVKGDSRKLGWGSRFAGYTARNHYEHQIRGLLADGQPVSLSRLRARLIIDGPPSEIVPRSDNAALNQFTGELIREEDSPGNFVILPEGEGRHQLFWHDAIGLRHPAGEPFPSKP